MQRRGLSINNVKEKKIRRKYEGIIRLMFYNFSYKILNLDMNELINNLLKVIDRMYIIGLRKLNFFLLIKLKVS